MFDVTIDTDALTATVHVHGELDIDTVPTLARTFEELFTGGTSRLVVDASELTFLDSTGISSLIAAFTRAQNLGGWFYVQDIGGMPLRALEITGIHGLLCTPPPEDAPRLPHEGPLRPS